MPSATNGNTSIYYETWGLGEDVLVFAHGAGGNAACWWQQIPWFVDRFRILAFDHRSFARSPCAKADVGVEHFAADLDAVLEQESIDRCFLVCQSMGGWTGVQFGSTWPERVRGLVMSHTPGGISTAEMIRLRDEAAGQLTAVEEPFAHWALAEDFHRTQPALANLYSQISNFNTEFDLQQLLPGMWQPVDAALIAKLQMPVLFITASGDRIFPPAFIELAAAEVAGATVEVLGDAGHSSYFENAPLFNQVVDEFISRCMDNGQ